MILSNCYPRNVLENYVNGDIEEDLTEAIEEHVRTCERCEDSISELDSHGDTLVRTLQIKGGVAQTNPDWLEQVANFDPNSPLNRSTPDSRAPNTSAGERFGDYELLGTLGRGGMSIVFAAKHKHLGSDVALKILMPTSQKHSLSRERFTREMRVIGGLTHPSIIRATDAGEYEDTLYLVMDQVDGVDLKKLARSQGPLSIADVCAIGVQVAQGLQHAHSQGIIHRDIKPSNLMLDRKGNVKILDFGLARIQSSRQNVTLQTTIGELLGTLDYMAPEQANGNVVGPQADIYALGATIFKLLTGAAPHGRSVNVPIIEFLNRLATNTAPRLDSKREQIPPGLSELIAQMLHTDLKKRERSSEVVANRLAKFAATANLKALIDRVPECPVPPLDTALLDPANHRFAELPTDTPPSQRRTTDVNPAFGRGPSGPIKWVLAAAGLIGATWLAILITLETPEGEFRVESEVLDSLTVEVVAEDNHVDLIAVDQGKASTTLRAGQYRIRLDRQSDSVQVTPNEVTISKDMVAVVKITRIEPAASVTPATDGIARPPHIVMSAQLQLQEAIEELKLSKSVEQPDESKINELQRKIDQLRALSQPIPTEPVLKGRTLADWTAQMRFEQESEAKKQASESVLELLSTLPVEEQLPLRFEANARQASWDQSQPDWPIRWVLANHADPKNSIPAYSSVDRHQLSHHIASQLNNSDPIFRNHAIVLCMGLRDQIRNQKFPILFESLRSLVNSENNSPAAHLSYALCMSNPADASKEILKIDLANASNGAIGNMLAALKEPNIQVDRDTQLDWTARYIAQATGSRDFFDWTSHGGLLSNISWDEPSDDQQQFIDGVATRILDRFENAINRVGASCELRTAVQERTQLEAAILSKSLAKLSRQTAFGAMPRQRTIDLFTRRIDQLIAARERSTMTSSSILNGLDTPADAASSILILGGSVPSSLQEETRPNSTAFRQFVPTKDTFGQGQLSFHNRMAFRWFPYQYLEIVTNKNLIGSMRLNRGYRPELFRGESIAILFDYVKRSGADFDALSMVKIDDPELQTLLRRHSSWQDRLRESIKTGVHSNEIEMAIKLIQSVNPETHVFRGWLRGTDPTRIRIALKMFSVADSSRSVTFPKELAPDVATGLQQLARTEPLRGEDLRYLEGVQGLFAGAAKHARDYIRQWLAKGELKTRSMDSGLYSASRILRNHHDQIREIEPDLRSALGNYVRRDGPRSLFTDKDTIFQLLTAISDDGNLKTKRGGRDENAAK